jgi:hypothetical protein
VQHRFAQDQFFTLGIQRGNTDTYDILANEASDVADRRRESRFPDHDENEVSRIGQPRWM